MIKLIASDIDGTLLQGKTRAISAEAFELIERLHEKGILFVAASGRQYPNLLRLFAPVRQKIMFICENGALIMRHDEVISTTEIPHELGCALMRDIFAHDGCEVLLSGKNTSYLQPKTAAYVDSVLNYSRNTVTIVDDLCAVDEPFLKISVYDKAGVAENSAPYFREKWSDKIQGAVAGHEWFDFTLADKGSAIALLRNRLGLEKSHLLAFGDNFNDIPMFRAVGQSYAMDSAAAEVRAAATHHTARVEPILRAVLEGKLDGMRG